jgi:hypothetical protein
MLSVAVLAAACGKQAIPTERLGRAEGAVRSAQETGAASEPSAALHLKLAQENLARAKIAVNEGNNERATYLLMRSEADAELAKSLNDESKAKRTAQQAINQLNMAKTSPQ